MLELRASRKAIWRKLLSGGWFAFGAVGIGLANLLGWISPDSLQLSVTAWMCTLCIPYVLYSVYSWFFRPIASFLDGQVRWRTLSGVSGQLRYSDLASVEIVEGDIADLLVLRPRGGVSRHLPVELPSGVDRTAMQARLEAEVGFP